MLDNLFGALNNRNLDEVVSQLVQLLAQRYAILDFAMRGGVPVRLIQDGDNKGKSPRHGRLVGVGQYGSPGKMTVEIKILVDGEDTPRVILLPQEVVERASLQLAIRYEETTLFVEF